MKAFLERDTKYRLDKVTQFSEPNFGDIIAYTSTSTIPLEVKVDEDATYPYPTHTNYSTMLHEQKVIVELLMMLWNALRN